MHGGEWNQSFENNPTMDQVNSEAKNFENFMKPMTKAIHSAHAKGKPLHYMMGFTCRKSTTYFHSSVMIYRLHVYKGKHNTL